MSVPVAKRLAVRLVGVVGVTLLLFSAVVGLLSYRHAYQQQMWILAQVQDQMVRTVQVQAEIAAFASNAATNAACAYNPSCAAAFATNAATNACCAAFATDSSFASFAACASTSNCTSKVVERSRLVSLQLVLRGQRLEALD